MTMLRLAVLISGSGSNLQAIMDAIQAETLPATISCVISNREAAYGLIRAQQAGIPTHIISAQGNPSREAYDQQLITTLATYEPDLIVLAGFMRILSPIFIHHFAHKIINIHPSLLPHYPGLHTHARVLAAKEKYHGASVHFVTEGLDEGPIIAHTRITALDQDTAETLQQRVLVQEHYLYPEILRWFAASRICLVDNKVYLDGKLVGPTGCEISPYEQSSSQ
jgi:phosphoribosylglycinamide formyltransferase-1